MNFDNVNIKYKSESLFMKMLGLLLFFNKDFMTKTVTTLGNTIYLPNKEFWKDISISDKALFAHELVHIYDHQRLPKPLFEVLYLFPQILAVFALPLYLLGFKFFAFLALLFLLPIPSPTRLYLEKRAHTIQLYILYLFNQAGETVDLEASAKRYSERLQSSYYYFAWPFTVFANFDRELEKIKNGEIKIDPELIEIIKKKVEELEKQ